MHATALAMLVALSGPELPPRLCPVAAIERGVTLRQWQAVQAAIQSLSETNNRGASPIGYWSHGLVLGVGGATSRAVDATADGGRDSRERPAPIPPAIPLPASLWLLLSGMAAVLGLKISRRGPAADSPEATGSGASLSPDPGAAASGAFPEGA